MIRLLRPEDRAEWLRLRVALWPAEPMEDQKREMQEILNDFDRMPVFVAERPDNTPGLCGLMEVTIHTNAPGCSTDRIGYLEAWYVDKAFRVQGIGWKLVAAAETWSREQGCTEMASDTDPSYPVSPTAHQHLGYEIAKVVGGDVFFCKKLS